MTAKLTVRIPAELHTEFKVAAARDRQSMEALLRLWIIRYVEHMKEAENGVVRPDQG